MEDNDVNSSSTNLYYQEFNKFQTLFYTDIAKFNNYSNYDIKKHAFVLLNNMAKGFSELADTFGNLYSPIVKTIQSRPTARAVLPETYMSSVYAEIATTPKNSVITRWINLSC